MIRRSFPRRRNPARRFPSGHCWGPQNTDHDLFAKTKVGKVLTRKSITRSGPLGLHAAVLRCRFSEIEGGNHFDPRASLSLMAIRWRCDFAIRHQCENIPGNGVHAARNKSDARMAIEGVSSILCRNLTMGASSASAVPGVCGFGGFLSSDVVKFKSPLELVISRLTLPIWCWRPPIWRACRIQQ